MSGETRKSNWSRAVCESGGSYGRSRNLGDCSEVAETEDGAKCHVSAEKVLDNGYLVLAHQQTASAERWKPAEPSGYGFSGGGMLSCKPSLEAKVRCSSLASTFTSRTVDQMKRRHKPKATELPTTSRRPAVVSSRPPKPTTGGSTVDGVAAAESSKKRVADA
eukprot:5254994-Prymnesium_polylepis.1